MHERAGVPGELGAQNDQRDESQQTDVKNMVLPIPTIRVSKHALDTVE